MTNKRSHFALFLSIIALNFFLSTNLAQQVPDSHLIIPNRQSIQVSLESGNEEKSFLDYEDAYGNLDLLSTKKLSVPSPSVIYDAHWKSGCFYLLMNKDAVFVKKGDLWFVKSSDPQVSNSANFYVSYRRDINPITAPNDMNEKYKTAEPDLNDIEKREIKFETDLSLKIKYLNEYNVKNPMDSSSVLLWKEILRYENLANNLSGIKYKLDRFPLIYLKSLTRLRKFFNRGEFIFLPAYKYAAWNFSIILNYQSNTKRTPSLLSHYEIIMENFSNDTRDLLLVKLLLNANDTKSNEYLTALSRFSSDCKNEQYKEYISQNTKLKNINFNEYQIINWQGKAVNLKDITAGKPYTYVDFWASWCAPCRAEMPASETLRDQFYPKGINFIYISIDDNPSAWRKAVETLKLPKDKCFLILNQKESKFKKLFDVSSIPHYALVDQSGKIIKNKYMRPSDKDISVQLNNLLQ